ncbi:LysR family transcriptional regulator [Thalassospira marina]|uniref:LysR family transcriptional regulator n=1 Tax=Thalassospira marina TaxID=2048283 RepID=A0A2N3KTX2_9PROT|nr:LysR family transcriptional regulator [Thalassospira marina]PKR53960.1 LysR family transcriptional regulator [Thalassospira marina]
MNYTGFDLNLIVAFDALMAERHVTRAAQRVGLTQPALSAALNRLRHITGDELFIRGPKGLMPTPRAVDLAPAFRTVLATVDGALALQKEFEPGRSRQTFALALAEHPAHLLLAPLEKAAREVAPGIDLRVRALRNRRDAIRMLDEGQADLAIGVSPGSESRILSRHLWNEDFVGIARKGTDIAPFARSAHLFAAERHVLFSPEAEDYGLVDTALAEHGLKRRLGVTSAYMYLVPGLVAQSDMLATVLQGVVRGSGLGDQLAVFKPPLELPTISYHLLWHRRTDAHPAHRWFRDIVVGLCQGF